MSFFDSTKNRAIWERRLSELRKEKEQRRENGYKPLNNSNMDIQKEKANPFRRHITLEELEKRELQQAGIRRVPRPGRELRMEREKEYRYNMENQGRQL